MMEAYLAMRIENRKLNYNAVVAKKPEYKEGIDVILLADGYTIGADGMAVKDVQTAI